MQSYRWLRGVVFQRSTLVHKEPTIFCCFNWWLSVTDLTSRVCHGSMSASPSVGIVPTYATNEGLVSIAEQFPPLLSNSRHPIAIDERIEGIGK